jgi:thiol-disulfide isomerase/thioredoxin
MNHMRWLIGCALIARAAAQAFSVPCEPSRETLKTLEALPPVQDYSISFEDRVGKRRALAEKYPDDFFVQRAYQAAFQRSPKNPAGEWDRALAFYRRRASSPMSRYLEAKLLMVAEPAKSRATFEALFAENPGFVWPHLDMLEWSRMPGSRENKEAEKQVKAFVAVCPGAVEGYDDLMLIQDPELIAKGARELRSALVRRDSRLDLARWPNLWTLERRAGVGPEALSERIRGDLKRIGDRPFEPLPELQRVYQAASEFLKDPAVLDDFEARVKREAPRSALMASLAEGRWFRENVPPGPDATATERKAYDDRRAGAVADWRGRWPEDCGLIQQQWMTLCINVQNDTAQRVEQVLAAADAMLQCEARSPDWNMSMPPLETMVAEVYARLGVRLDEVPRLLDAGLRAIDRGEKYRMSDELIPTEFRARGILHNRQLTEERTQLIRADYLIAGGRLAEARALIEQELWKLGQRPQTPRTKGFDIPQWRQRLAAVAEKEGHFEEALSLYQLTLRGAQREMLAKAEFPRLARIKQFYLAHGGTEDKWLDWASSGNKEPGLRHPAPEFSQTLPEFSAQDFTGRTWRLANLNGKATFVNYWATWCGPCRGEHPAVQKLYERVKDRWNLQVVTVSVDEDLAAAKAYMKEKGFTFPVIDGREIADRLFPYAGLPSNFLVNPAGRRTSFYGFVGGEEGLKRVIADMEGAVPAPK